MEWFHAAKKSLGMKAPSPDIEDNAAVMPIVNPTAMHQGGRSRHRKKGRRKTKSRKSTKKSRKKRHKSRKH